MKKFSNVLKAKKKLLRPIPNALTLCNSLCGFAAILYTLRAYEKPTHEALWVFVVSSIMIFSAMIFDAFDGFAARLLDAASLHGIQMDSLSDMVTFGVAPATLVAIMTHCLRDWSLNRTQEIWVYLLCSVYLGGAALRLATYNVHAMLEKKSSDKFSGLPSPGAAAAICVVVFFAYAWCGTTEEMVRRLAFLLPGYAALLGVLMTSSIPYTHAAKWLLSVRRSRKRLVMLIVMIVIAVIFRTAGLAALVTAYVLSGPVLVIVQSLRKSLKPEAN